MSQMFIQFGLLVIALLSLLLSQAVIAKHPEVTLKREFWKNYGFYCEKNPTCICSGTFNDYSIRCDKVVEISAVLNSGQATIEVSCKDDAIEDAFKSLDLMPLKSFEQGLDMTIRWCPAPSSNYFTLTKIKIGKEDVNKTEDEDNISPLTSLTIVCSSSKESKLHKRHFLLLNSLKELKVHCPGMSQVPSDLLSGLPEDMKSITIGKTSLSSFTKGLISRFTQLNELNLSENRVTKFPTDFFKVFGNISYLNISSNILLIFDEDAFQNNVRLTLLDISKNLLQKLPNSLCSLNNLTKLFLQDNRLVSIQTGCFFKMDSLQILDLSDNQLKSLEYRDATWNGRIVEPSSFEDQGGTISDQIYPFLSPKFISTHFSSQSSHGVLMSRNDFVIGTIGYRVLLRNNSLESIPENFFFGFRRLYRVDLSSNKLSKLPPKLFSRNKVLSMLNLSNNNLTHIPEELLSTNLKIELLNISSNSIKTLGVNFLLGLKKLAALDLSKNMIETLPREIFLSMDQTIDYSFARFRNSFTLNLEGNQLRELPMLAALPRISVLNLSRNRLTTLCPEGLKDLEYLERFNASHNLIDVADCETGILFPPHLQWLSEVDMSHNRLTEAPAIHGVHTHLRTLVLSSNLIGSLQARCSPATDDYAALQHVDLSDNRLTWADYCSHTFGRESYLVNVKTLDFSRNTIRLECSPEVEHSANIWGCSTHLKAMKKIEEINLAHNEIEFLPMEFRHHLPKLRLVDLRYNKIKMIWYQDFLVSNGVSQEMLEILGYSEDDFIRREHRDGGYYYEYPNSHQLTIDVRHNQIQALDLPKTKLMAVRRDCHMEDQFASVTLLLGHNPIVCSCQIFRLLRYALRELRPVSEMERTEGFRFIMPTKIDIEGLSCSERGCLTPADASGIVYTGHPLVLVHVSHHVLRRCSLSTGAELIQVYNSSSSGGVINLYKARNYPYENSSGNLPRCAVRPSLIRRPGPTIFFHLLESAINSLQT